MDAIVTIQVLDGKKVIGTIEKAVEIHPTIANEIKDIPGVAGAWILGEARAKFNDEGAQWSTPREPEPPAVEPEPPAVEPEPPVEKPTSKKAH